MAECLSAEIRIGGVNRSANGTRLCPGRGTALFLSLGLPALTVSRNDFVASKNVLRIAVGFRHLRQYA